MTDTQDTDDLSEDTSGESGLLDAELNEATPLDDLESHLVNVLDQYVSAVHRNDIPQQNALL
jgi:hypothetical protein